MKRNKLLALLMVGSYFLLAGCGAGGGYSATPYASGSTQYYGDYAEKDFAGEYDTGMSMAVAPTAVSDSIAPPISGDKRIVYADITIQTTDFEQSKKTLDALVAELNGYYGSASVYAGGSFDVNYFRSGQYVIRIPEGRYKDFIAALETLGHISYESQSSENVGQQYYDTEARLKTQRAKHERLLMLMEKAENMEDIITIEHALSEVEYEIEQLTTTLNHYDGLISYATIRLDLNEVLKVDAQVGERESLGTRMGAGFVASIQGLISGTQNLLVWVSYNIFAVIVLLAILGGGFGAGLRLTKREKKKKDVLDRDKRSEE